MPDTLFCPKCGTSNQPDFMFCTSCGFALSTISKRTPENTSSEKTPPPYTAPVQNKPAAVAAPAKAASSLPRWAPAVIVIVVLAGIGFLIWNNEQSKNKNPSGKGSGLTQNENGTQDNNDISAITNPPGKIQVEDFAGVWRVYDSNDPERKKIKLGDPKDDLFIEVSNGQPTIYPRNELDKERSTDIDCNEVVGNTINCKAKNKEDGLAFSLKLELASSKNEMTITIIPEEATETLIIKARRLNETGN